MSRFQPDRPYYWQKISDFVVSRNPAECQRKFELIRNPCKRGPGPVKKKIQKVVRPQVEAGTLVEPQLILVDSRFKLHFLGVYRFLLIVDIIVCKIIVFQ